MHFILNIINFVLNSICDIKVVLMRFLSLRPNSFVIITANRVIHCNTDTPEEMHHWIGLLQKPKGDSRIDGQEFIVRGESDRSVQDTKIYKTALYLIHY